MLKILTPNQILNQIVTTQLKVSDKPVSTEHGLSSTIEARLDHFRLSELSKSIYTNQKQKTILALGALLNLIY